MFSERLKSIIEKTGMPVYTLAKKAGVNRPMIHKSQQGDSIPSADFIEKLSDAMMLTNVERKELLSLAARARMGEKLYLKRQSVLKVINCLCVEFDEIDLVALWKNKSQEHTDGGYIVLNDCRQIKHVLLEMIKGKMESPKDEKIYICLPEQAKEFFSIVYHLWSSKEAENIQLTQFIGLEKEYNSNESAVHNLSLLSYALNFCLMTEKSIKVRYYYLNYSKNMDLPAMPYYIKIEDGVLALSADLNKGIYYDGGMMLDFYDDIVRERLENSKLLIKEVENMAEIINYRGTYALIESIPCISSIVTDDLLNSAICVDMPERDYFLALTRDFYHDLQENDRHPISFFQMEKLEKFMRDGILPTVPQEWVRALTLKERHEMVEKFSNIMKRSDKQIYYAVNPDKLHILVDAEIALTKEDGVMIRRFIEGTSALKIIWIKEPSCVEAFTDFFTYFPTSNLVLKQEEAIKQIERILANSDF
ncbi:MAG: helix-turn-helix transcriptional regulator [Eubacterium sp.]